MFGYDYVLSIEHEDSLMSAEEGLEKAAVFLNSLVIQTAGERGLVGVMKKLKAAVFGTGFVGRVHIEGIRRLGNVEVYAIGVGPEDDAVRLGAELYVERVSQDYRRLLADPEIDAVHVCTPNALHFPIVKAALEAGQARAVREAAGDVGGGGARDGRSWLEDQAAELHVPQPALLPDGAAGAPDV